MNTALAVTGGFVAGVLASMIGSLIVLMIDRRHRSKPHDVNADGQISNMDGPP